MQYLFSAYVKSIFLGTKKHKTYQMIMVRTNIRTQTLRGTFNNKDFAFFKNFIVFCFNPLDISISSSVIIPRCPVIIYR
jgi:hypothetical protein